MNGANEQDWKSAQGLEQLNTTAKWTNSYPNMQGSELGPALYVVTTADLHPVTPAHK